METTSNQYFSNDILLASMGKRDEMKEHVTRMCNAVIFSLGYSKLFAEHVDEVRESAIAFTLDKLDDYDESQHGTLFSYIKSKLKYKICYEHGKLKN